MGDDSLGDDLTAPHNATSGSARDGGSLVSNKATASRCRSMRTIGQGKRPRVLRSTTNRAAARYSMLKRLSVSWSRPAQAFLGFSRVQPASAVRCSRRWPALFPYSLKISVQASIRRSLSKGQIWCAVCERPESTFVTSSAPHRSPPRRRSRAGVSTRMNHPARRHLELRHSVRARNGPDRRREAVPRRRPRVRAGRDKKSAVREMSVLAGLRQYQKDDK
jgi:hypothetical protein